jgi:hypothetical protein
MKASFIGRSRIERGSHSERYLISCYYSRVKICRCSTNLLCERKSGGEYDYARMKR